MQEVKEAHVFHATSANGAVAVKIFHTTNAVFKGLAKYIDGDPRFSGLSGRHRELVNIWVKKEFRNLRRMRKYGIRVPLPISYHKNVLVMELIGSERKALWLRDIEIKEKFETFTEMLDMVAVAWQKANLVHADLSEYNILWHGGEPWFIDVGQGVTDQHPHSEEFLVRDVSRLVHWISKQGYDVELADCMLRVLEEPVPELQPLPGGIKERSPVDWPMEPVARIPKDRIAVIIGRGGATRKMIEEACGAKLEIDSRTGEVSVDWADSEVDPVIRMKTPDVILAIGRGLSPKRAVQLLEDEIHLQVYDIREWVGRQPNQIRRMRSRLIGRNGLIRSRIEDLSGTEIAIYGSSVIIIGDDMGLEIAKPAIESILRGAEHGSVLHGLEKDRKRQRIRSRSLETYEERSEKSSAFDSLVPGLSAARRRRERRLADSQVDPEDSEAVKEMLELAEDEKIII